MPDQTEQQVACKLAPVAKVSTYFPALTGLRAVAAFAVFAFHYNPFPVAGVGWRPLAHCLVGELHIGVTIFFVLSGFLICHRYYDVLAQRPARWLSRYWLARFARIYPLYLLLTILTFGLFVLNPARYEPTYDGLTHATGKQQVGIFLLNVSLLKGFFDQYKLSGIAQGWSLTVEGCFYLGAPWFIPVFRRGPWAGLWLAGCCLLLVGLGVAVGQLNWHGLFGGWAFSFNYTFQGRCIEFFAGMALAVYVRLQQQAAHWPAQGGCTVAGGVLLAACLLALAFIGGPANARDMPAGILLSNLIVPVAVCLLLYGLLRERTWLRALLSTQLLELLGRSSYAFYLVHLGVISVALRTYVSASPLVAFLLLNVLAIGLYAGVERPLYRLLTQRAHAPAESGH
jgi:peptidoglycan/LPS O-acetylase OafA/YrhL